MPVDHHAAKSIFLDALDRSAAERAAYLDTACAGNRALRQHVETMLRAHEVPDKFLDRPAALLAADEDSVHEHQPTEHIRPAAPPLPEPAPPGTEEQLAFLGPSTREGSLGRLGHYEIQKVLGRGAFGTVLKAFDDVLQRVVAVKVLAAELCTSPPARQRFLREARAAAAVRTEHVVHIYAVDEQPLPHIVMECIIGQTLQDKIDRCGVLELAEVLRIGHQIASGLAAAHAQGLVHRDIKPANILLENGIERVKITDFGLARAADDASLTQSGFVAGTPMYMAPEQALAEPLDQRVDLFSLGSVLYVMCTGNLPFRATTSLGVLRQVCDETPRPVREINPAIPDWLAALIARLHAKKPRDRYGSAREVAELLGARLAELQLHGSRPVQVARRSPSRWSVAAALLLAAFGLVLAEATGVTHVASALGRWLGAGDVPLAKVDNGAGPAPVAPAQEQPAQPLDGRRREDIPPALLAQAEAVAANPAPFQLVAVLGAAPIGHGAAAKACAFSPDGRLLASSGADRSVKLWDLGAWDRAAPAPPVRTLPGQVDRAYALAFSPDGRWLAAANAGLVVRVWELPNGDSRHLLERTAPYMQRLAFSPDSKRLAAGTEEGAIRFLDLAAGTDAEMPAHNARVRAVAFSPDGALLASGSADAKVRVHDVASGRRLAALELPTVANNVAFAADGKTLGAVCDAPDSGLHLWDVSTPAAPRHLRQIPAHRGNVHGLAFSPTVPLVATRGIDGFVHLWDWSRAAPCVASLDTGDAEAHDHGVAFAPDGRYLALTHESGAISVVRLPAP